MQHDLIQSLQSAVESMVANNNVYATLEGAKNGKGLFTIEELFGNRASFDAMQNVFKDIAKVGDMTIENLKSHIATLKESQPIHTHTNQLSMPMGV